MSSTNKLSKKKFSASNSSPSCFYFGLTILNVILFGGSIYTYLSAKTQLTDAASWTEKAKSMMAFTREKTLALSVGTVSIGKTSEHGISNDFSQESDIKAKVKSVAKGNIDDIICNDPIWCFVPMPSLSHYKFEPPTDKVRWRIAQPIL
jgi:hypothetical protein